MTVIGQGEFRYQFASPGRNWGEPPEGWRFGDVAAVGVDGHDRVYVFARAELCMCCRAANTYFYTAELAPGREFINRDWPGPGPRVSILARLGDYGGPDAPSPFIAPHGIAVDSRGAIYVAELSHAVMGKKVAGQSERPLVTLQKLSPVP